MPFFAIFSCLAYTPVRYLPACQGSGTPKVVMAAKPRFIIKRKDGDVAIDDVMLESDGLTIGRLISNDLLLNHRAVSRTHAGIKEVGGDFWLFNFSASNGTSLNGELVDRTPLADGDVI